MVQHAPTNAILDATKYKDIAKFENNPRKPLRPVSSVLTCPVSGQAAPRGRLRGRFRPWRAKTEEDQRSPSRDGTDASNKNELAAAASNLI